MKSRKPNSLIRSVVIHASQKKVFRFMDDISKTGMHMSESSVMMFGSKLRLDQVSKNEKGIHSVYRWWGRMLGMRLDFTVVVTKWKENEEKVWETIGKADMIIMSWYKMHLLLKPVPEGTRAFLSINYERPKNFFYRIFSYLFAWLYCCWCLHNMLRDSKAALEQTNELNERSLQIEYRRLKSNKYIHHLALPDKKISHE